MLVIRILRCLATFCASLVMGLTLSHVLQAPGSLHLDGAQWLAVQHSFYGGFAVVGGAAEIIGLASTIVVAIVVRGDRVGRGVAVVAAVCFVGTLAAFAVGNAPVNAQVSTWTAATLPSDWTTARARWEAAHAVSAVFGLTATALLLWDLQRRNRRTGLDSRIWRWRFPRAIAHPVPTEDSPHACGRSLQGLDARYVADPQTTSALLVTGHQPTKPSPAGAAWLRSASHRPPERSLPTFHPD